MSQFMIRFLFCNLFLMGFIGALLCVKYFFRHCLSARIQFNLWFPLFAVMLLPFLPFRIPGIWELFQFAGSFSSGWKSNTDATQNVLPASSQTSSLGWADDFAVSVSREFSSVAGTFLFGVWLLGIAVMLLLFFRSVKNLKRLKASALPLQNEQVSALFFVCTHMLHITRPIAVYSTAFLKSPVTTGILHPKIYLPIHLISDYNEKDMRYILLHELQHYRYKDALPNFFMNLIGILYWFNPLVWYARKEMCTDREIACDSAVLQCLSQNDYKDYGNTLINFAEKISFSLFPFCSGLGGNMTQIKKRIINIASYRPSTLKQKVRDFCIFGLITFFLLGAAPLLSTYAAAAECDSFQSTGKTIDYPDYSSYFGDYDGSFVLYDEAKDCWKIYHREFASMRVSPDSTYKIYEGLIGLETETISRASSAMSWDKTNYPFASWNANQDLNSAMGNSVNWYFERIEQSIGLSTIQTYLNEFSYGNKDMSSGSTYWMEGSLKISPVEQVALLKDFHTNKFGVKQSNIDTIEDAICISSDADQSFFGKTGTGRVNGSDINGWFIGYVEQGEQVYYFATNIQGKANATGKAASKITQSILNDLQILN